MVEGLGIEERLIHHSSEALAQARHIVAFTGPGISATSDRTPIHPDQLGGARGISLDSFLENPHKVWQWYNRRKDMLRTTCPSPVHYALAEMEDLLEGFMLITQNTDGLHQKAGATKLVEINGNIWTARCVHCDYQTHTEDHALGNEPHCPVCGQWLRPDVVWPGEPVPEEEFSAAREAGELADLMLSIGTSGEHQPAASMIWQAKATDAVIIEINPTITSASHLADIRLQTLPEKAIPALVAELKALLLQAAR